MSAERDDYEYAPDCIVSLRDQFAMAAMQGLIAYPGREGENNDPQHFARWSYALADAMLAERSR